MYCDDDIFAEFDQFVVAVAVVADALDWLMSQCPVVVNVDYDDVVAVVIVANDVEFEYDVDFVVVDVFVVVVEYWMVQDYTGIVAINEP